MKQLFYFIVFVTPLIINTLVVANEQGICVHVYHSNGHRITPLPLASLCDKAFWYIYDNHNRLRNFTLSDPEEEDFGLISSPPDEISIALPADIDRATHHVSNQINLSHALRIAATESWGRLDFSSSFASRTLIDGVLYGTSCDSGNFLWGYSMAKMGIPYSAAKLGSELNALIFDHHHKFDSQSDQNAIRHGYQFYFKTHPKP